MANTREPNNASIMGSIRREEGFNTLDINRDLVRRRYQVPQSIPRDNKTLDDIVAVVMATSTFSNKIKDRPNKIEIATDNIQKNMDVLAKSRENLASYNELQSKFIPLKGEGMEKNDQRKNFIQRVDQLIKERDLSIEEILRLISRSNTPTAQVQAMLDHMTKRFLDLARDYKTLRTNERPTEIRLGELERDSFRKVADARSKIPTAAAQASPTYQKGGAEET